jgi:flagellar assembly protein FliH
MGLIKSADVPLSVSAFSMVDVEAAAKQILRRARVKSDEIVTAAHEDAVRTREEAKKEGFAEGKMAGHAEGLAEGKKSGHAQALAENLAAMTKLVNSLTQAMGQLENERDQLQTNAINEVVKLACLIARKVTKRQGLFDTQVMFENLKEAMSLAVHASDVRIAVHPGQVETLRAELPHLRMAWPHLKHIRLIDDPSIAPGGAKVFTPHGEIDGDLDAQLERLAAQLLPGETGEKI